MKKKIIALILLVVAGVIAWIYTSNDNDTLSGFETEFAVEDVSKLTRIFIATTGGLTADLKKKDGTWYINDRESVRQDAIDFTLETLNTLRIHSPVPNKGKEALTRDLASRHKKIELYRNNESKPYKTIYIGSANQTLNANLCLVETARKGKASTPYYVGKLGHKGIISPIFFTTDKEWINTKIFEYPNLNFKKLEELYPLDTARSFAVVKSGDDITLTNPYNGKAYPRKVTNSFALNEYLERYKMVHFEAINENFSAEKTDSLIATTPIAILRITELTGLKDSVLVFRKFGDIKNLDNEKIGEGTDLDYFHGWHHNRLVKLQRFVFNPILYVKEDFLMEN